MTHGSAVDTMRKGLGSLVVLLVLVGVPALTSAQGTPLGNEFQVNTYTTGLQIYPAVATDAAGNFVVVWESDRQDGSNFGVFGQRFSNSGAPLGTEFQVNTYTTGNQDTYPSSNVAADALGNFVVVWTSSGQDGSLKGVFGQRFANTGARVGTEFQVNTYTSGDQSYPAVVSDAAGNFVVVWHSASNQDGSGRGVFGQRFSNTGAPLGTEFQVNTYTTADQKAPALAIDAAGNFVVVWQSAQAQDGSEYGVFGQRFANTGARVGTEFQVNTYTTYSQKQPAVASDATGNFTVVWQSEQDGSNNGVFGQRFSSTGARVGTEFQVNTYTTDRQDGPAVAMDATGNFVVVWVSDANQDGDSFGVFGQRFGSNGARVGTEFQVNTYTTGYQGSYPESVAVSPDHFVVVWTDKSGEDGSSRGVFAQRFSPLTSPQQPKPVPALGAAGLILLGLGLVLLGSTVLVRRRRRADVRSLPNP